LFCRLHLGQLRSLFGLHGGGSTAVVRLGVIVANRVIGDYDILRELDERGGMAVVYLASQRRLGRTVALKQVDLRVGGDLVERFVREARLAGSLNHPNVVTVYDFFEHDNVPYIAMEFVEGGSLRAWIGRLELAQVLGVLEGVLAGLGHAHATGIVHRDVKPENILVTTSGTVKLTDFGIARAFATVSGRLTKTGMTVGTPAYMAPEQALNRELGPWTDLYATGVVAYEMLLRRAPFEATDTPIAVLLQHVNDPVPAPRTLDPSLDGELDAWLQWILAKDPRARPDDALTAWEALEEIAVRVLGPLWRRDARLADRAASASPRPLTPAEFAAPGQRGPSPPVGSREAPADHAVNPPAKDTHPGVDDASSASSAPSPSCHDPDAPADAPELVESTHHAQSDEYLTFEPPAASRPPVRTAEELSRLPMPTRAPKPDLDDGSIATHDRSAVPQHPSDHEAADSIAAQTPSELQPTLPPTRAAGRASPEPTQDRRDTPASRPPMQKPSPARAAIGPADVATPQRASASAPPPTPASGRPGHRMVRIAEIGAAGLAVILAGSLSRPYFFACAGCSGWHDFPSFLAILLAAALATVAALPLLRMFAVGRAGAARPTAALAAATLIVILVIVPPNFEGGANFRFMRDHSEIIPGFSRWSTHPARWVGAACALAIMATSLALAYEAWRTRHYHANTSTVARPGR
jgi:serine/threonine protein kinase